MPFEFKRQTPEDQKYCGGTLFVDISSGKVSVHHLNSTGTIQSKVTFEREAWSAGVSINDYLSDNGIYTCVKFTRELAKHGHGLKKSGVGAHHQNGVAERAIKTVLGL